MIMILLQNKGYPLGVIEFFMTATKTYSKFTMEDQRLKFLITDQSLVYLRQK